MEDEPAGSKRARERGKVLLVAAPVVLIFSLTDSIALSGSALAKAFLLRALWAAALVAVAFALPRSSGRAERLLLCGLAAASALVFSMLVQMTGGFRSPLFHFMVAMPVTIAIVVQDIPAATLTGGIVTVAGGLAVLLLSQAPVAVCVHWLVQAVGMTALAVFASLTYLRMRMRELRTRQEQISASERARAYEEAVKARDEFLSVASHELKTPMTSLQLQVESLLRANALSHTTDTADRAGEPAGRNARRLEIMSRQVRRLSTLIETLLDVSRIASGKLLLCPDEVDLAHLTRDVVARFAHEAEAASAVVRVAGDPVLEGRWDPMRLEQILTNLISNALKYGAGRPVEVTVTGTAEKVHIAVRDQGIGIAPADRARVFERFERAEGQRNITGLGLGLWITRRIVEAMGGRILLVSEAGQGSTFTVELPRRASAQDPSLSGPRRASG